MAGSASAAARDASAPATGIEALDIGRPPGIAILSTLKGESVQDWDSPPEKK